jgi:two-component system sensor histidine kinase BaeS
VIERSIVLPVRRLRAAAQRLGRGDLTARAPQVGGGEIGDLGDTFNTMAKQIAEREERLTELDRLKSEFVSSVSHELKTPLTTIKLLARLLQRSDIAEEEKLDYAKTIAVECDRQIDLVVNLLDLSRIESGSYQLRKTRVDVPTLIASCVKIERYRAESLGFMLVTNVPSELPAVTGDIEALRRVIRSLIDNAIKYTQPGGHIKLSARELDDKVEITVSDTGKGIAESDVPHIFDKFYRAASDAENSTAGVPGTAASGVGLGLYLAQHIVAQLNGKISVESKQSVGTTFSVILPLWFERSAAERTEENSNAKAVVGS